MWKTIPNFDNYSASTKGEIRNDTTGLVLKQTLGIDMYFKVMLVKNGFRYTKRVNRLIAETFLPNPNNLPQVNHIDGNKRNNSVDNLEWCDAKHNIIHSYENRLNPNSTFITVVDNIKGTTSTHRSIKNFSKQLGIKFNVLLPMILHSDINPIQGRYTITVTNPNEMFTNNNSVSFGKSVYVYDCVDGSLKYYSSLALASYFTGLRSLYCFNKYYFKIGYSVAETPEDAVIKIEYDIDKLKKERLEYWMMPYKKYYSGIKLYNYYTKEELCFEDRDSALEYLNSLEPLENKISVNMLAEKASYANKTYTHLVKGFGVKTTDPKLNDLMYYPWSEEAILSSLYGCKAITAFYKIINSNGEEEIVMGLSNVYDKLDVPHNLRSNSITQKIKNFLNSKKCDIVRLKQPIS